MMNTTPQLYSYKNVALVAFLKDVLLICNSYNTSLLQIKAEIALIKANLKQMGTKMDIAKTNSNTQRLVQLDERRDEALVGIIGLIQSYQKHYNSKKRLAGEVLLKTMHQYGKRIAWQNYLTETQNIRSIIAVLETNTFAIAAIAELGIADWIAELKEANEAFNTLYLLRNDELAVQPKQSLRSLKKPAIENYRNLVEVIKAHDKLKPNTEYAKLLRQIGELSIKYNGTIGENKKDTSNEA